MTSPEILTHVPLRISDSHESRHVLFMICYDLLPVFQKYVPLLLITNPLHSLGDLFFLTHGTLLRLAKGDHVVTDNSQELVKAQFSTSGMPLNLASK